MRCPRQGLDQRVRDGVLRRAIDKWLKAGVLEDGALTYPESGTPQGGVISPLLANIYLHEVLDRWFEQVVEPRLEGKAFLIRYADDFVLVFASERDAQRVMKVLPQRFGKYGLTLHPEKTRLVDFRKPPQARERTGGAGSFDLLGFTHHWGRTRKGRWVVKRKTSAKRFTRAVKTIAQWCRANRHASIATEHWGGSSRGTVRTMGSPETHRPWPASVTRSTEPGSGGSIAAASARGCRGSASNSSSSTTRFHRR